MSDSIFSFIIHIADYFFYKKWKHENAAVLHAFTSTIYMSEIFIYSKMRKKSHVIITTTCDLVKQYVSIHHLFSDMTEVRLNICHSRSSSSASSTLDFITSIRSNSSPDITNGSKKALITIPETFFSLFLAKLTAYRKCFSTLEKLFPYSPILSTSPFCVPDDPMI